MKSMQRRLSYTITLYYQFRDGQSHFQRRVFPRHTTTWDFKIFDHESCEQSFFCILIVSHIIDALDFLIIIIRLVASSKLPQTLQHPFWDIQSYLEACIAFSFSSQRFGVECLKFKQDDQIQQLLFKMLG
ncbi:Hypothetical_protein [Hexamita inflata]|uniref:Hypothetical_protein n=1 Tax=Hexamita inflata TaxID=28002 RepID=A0AA86PRU9_9EUKA|nr:Hypothetical protein HINF_LOCUS32825 [Hexamita inflata]